jgi:hypothetical protein
MNMTTAQERLRERLQKVLGTMEILESEVHVIMHIALSNGCDEEESQALRQQRSFRKEIKVLRKFLKA